MNDIFEFAENFSKVIFELTKKKQEQQRLNRIKGQNRPFTKNRKSKSMKKYWEEKRQKEIDDKENEILRVEYIQEHCTCHLGNPPCAFCTKSNYCEDCDINTIDENCPKCGREF
jgi:hypothetical protein